jgi:hypothetical protein
LELFFGNQRLKWKILDCGLITRKLEGLFAKWLRLLELANYFSTRNPMVWVHRFVNLAAHKSMDQAHTPSGSDLILALDFASGGWDQRGTLFGSARWMRAVLSSE